MALLEGRGARLEYDISNIINEAVSEPGVIACFKTANYGSGEALGQTAGQLEVPASSSGALPAGAVMVKVVDVDETLQIRNYHNDSMTVGDPVQICVRGVLTTNTIVGAPTPGATAYLLSSGYIGPTLNADGGLAATPKVGRFESQVDENGYAKVRIEL